MFKERQDTTTNNLKDHKILKRKDSKIDLIEDYNLNI